MAERTPRWIRALAVLLLCLCPLLGHATAPRWGVALNTSVNGEVMAMRLVPSATLRLGKTQLEAGVGLHPYIRTDQRVLSGELNAKVFPNGTGNALDLYLIGRAAAVRNQLQTHYPTTLHHLFLLGGYGLQLTRPQGVSVGTNVAIGPTTRSRTTTNPYPGVADDRMFDELGVALAFQFHLGMAF